MVNIQYSGLGFSDATVEKISNGRYTNSAVYLYLTRSIFEINIIIVANCVNRAANFVNRRELLQLRCKFTTAWRQIPWGMWRQRSCWICMRSEVNVGSVFDVRGHAEYAWGKNSEYAWGGDVIDAIRDVIEVIRYTVDAFWWRIHWSRSK